MSTRKSATFKVTTSQKVKSAIDKWTASGTYASPGEFIEEAVREKLKRAAKEHLDQLLLEGINSGPPIPFDEAFKTDFLKELAARSKARRATTKTKSKPGAA